MLQVMTIVVDVVIVAGRDGNHGDLFSDNTVSTGPSCPVNLKMHQASLAVYEPPCGLLHP